MAGHQISDDRTCAAGVHNGRRRECSGDIVLRRHVTEAAEAAVFALPFIGKEEESLVLDYGTAQRAAELVVVERILRNGGAVKEVARVEGAVAKEFKWVWLL